MNAKTKLKGEEKKTQRMQPKIDAKCGLKMHSYVHCPLSLCPSVCLSVSVAVSLYASVWLLSNRGAWHWLTLNSARLIRPVRIVYCVSCSVFSVGLFEPSAAIKMLLKYKLCQYEKSKDGKKWLHHSEGSSSNSFIRSILLNTENEW